MTHMRNLARAFRGQRSVSDAFLASCRAKGRAEFCVGVAEHANDAARDVAPGRAIRQGTSEYCAYHALREFMWAALDASRVVSS